MSDDLPNIADVKQMDEHMQHYLSSRVRRGWDLVLHLEAPDRDQLAAKLEELALRIRDDDKLADGHSCCGSGGWWHLAIRRWYQWDRDDHNQPVALPAPESPAQNNNNNDILGVEAQ